MGVPGLQQPERGHKRKNDESIRHNFTLLWSAELWWGFFFVIFCVFFGLCKVEGGQSERHSAPERCRYASDVACNAHHASHVNVLCRPLFWARLEVFTSTPTLLALCQRLPTCCQKDDDFGNQPPQGHQGVHPHLLWVQVITDWRMSWEGFGKDFGEDFWRGNFGEDFGRIFWWIFCWIFFVALPAVSLQKKNPQKNPHQNPHRKIRTRKKSAPKKSAPKNPHQKIHTKNPYQNLSQKSAHKNPHSAHKTPHTESLCTKLRAASS